jgi:hypothetical protein
MLKPREDGQPKPPVPASGSLDESDVVYVAPRDVRWDGCGAVVPSAAAAELPRSKLKAPGRAAHEAPPALAKWISS